MVFPRVALAKTRVVPLFYTIDREKSFYVLYISKCKHRHTTPPPGYYRLSPILPQ